jgi:phage-related protein
VLPRCVQAGLSCDTPAHYPRQQPWRVLSHRPAEVSKLAIILGVESEWRIEAEDARTRFYLQLLTEHGSTLAMPYARSLGNGLRELRFHLRDEQRRITFWIAPDRRIVLLTTFRKQRQNERREVERAHNVLKQAQQEFDR